MSDLCNNCRICCKLIPIKANEKLLIRDGLQPIDDDFLSYLTELSEEEEKNISSDYVAKIKEVFPDAKFYFCKNLTTENECSLKEKPFVCKTFPSSPLAIVPDECGYLGEVFLKNEELKRKIRMIKEEILDYQNLIETGDSDSASYKKIIDNLNRFVTKYKDFGSENW